MKVGDHVQPWNPDQRRHLRKRYCEDGASYGVIAKEWESVFGFPRSRSSIASKVLNLKMPSHGRPKIELPNAGRERFHDPGKRPIKPRRRMIPVDVVAVPGRECSIWELDATRCRYPIGEPRKPGFHFCGQQPIEKSPYCAVHHRLTHA